MAANNWIKKYYGHFEHPVKMEYVTPKWLKIKRVFESLLNNKFGNALDKLFMRITWKRWKQKFPQFAYDKFELTMRSKRDVSKHHPSDFQTRVLAELHANKKAALKRYNDNL